MFCYYTEDQRHLEGGRNTSISGCGRKHLIAQRGGDNFLGAGCLCMETMD